MGTFGTVIFWIVVIAIVLYLMSILDKLINVFGVVMWICFGLLGAIIGIGYVISLFTGDEPMTVIGGIIQFLKALVGSFFEGIREGMKNN